MKKFTLKKQIISVLLLIFCCNHMKGQSGVEPQFKTFKDGQAFTSITVDQNKNVWAGTDKAMRRFFSPRQLAHAPVQELHNGGFTAYAESPARAAQMARLAHFRAPDWPGHFRAVDAFLTTL